MSTGCTKTFTGIVKYAVLYKGARSFKLIDSEELQRNEPHALLRFFEKHVVINQEAQSNDEINTVGAMPPISSGLFHRPRILGEN